MEDVVTLNCGGDIISLPISALKNKKNMLWFNQERFGGDNVKLAAIAAAGYKRYCALTGQTWMSTPDVWPKPLKRNRFQFWLRNKLTHWSII
jgi:hypothetical protein